MPVHSLLINVYVPKTDLMKCKLFIIAFAALMLSCGMALPVCAEGLHQDRDTLMLRILFRSGNGTEIDFGYAGNGERIVDFSVKLSEVLSDGGSVSGVHVVTSSSPEGTFSLNMKLSRERGAAVVDFLSQRFFIPKDIMSYESMGEDWLGFIEAVREMDVPWKNDVLSIIEHKGLEDGRINDVESKNALKQLDGGRVWSELIDKVFPTLRAARCDTYIVIERKTKETEKAASASVETTVPVTEAKPMDEPEAKIDTVYIDRIVEVPVKKKAKPLNLEGKKLIFAVKTNILAVPFANVGVSIPIGEHWSIGGDWYYPWIWRNDLHKDCFEFLGGDIEARYWFRSKKLRKEQRLTGVSIGIYAAIGHYDFERDWNGYQGRFYNAGVDLLYAMPIWGGRMHFEFELGVGYIWSVAQPYECLEPYGDCFRIVGKNRLVRWIGPTRAQVSIVVPIYVKTKKGGAK